MPDSNPISRAAVWEALMHVEDPELGVDIVNLGLVRDVSIAGGSVDLLMTLTSIGCPVADDLTMRVQAALAEVPGVAEARVTFTFEPPWTPSAITEEGRDQLMALGYI